MVFLSNTIVMKFSFILFVLFSTVVRSFVHIPGQVRRFHQTKYAKNTFFNDSPKSKNVRKLQQTKFKASSIGLIDTIQNSNTSSMLNLGSLLMLASYHLMLCKREISAEDDPKNRIITWRLYQAETREKWANHVRDTEGWLYAIQTLRNAITAQTFLASTVLSLLTLITGRLWDILRITTDDSEKRLLIMQTLSIAMTMLSSAYQFLQGVRLMTHVGFMFPVVKKDDSKVDKLMRKTQNCQWLGLRWLYISVAPISWVIGGSRAFFATSTMLVLFFNMIDKVPQGLS